MARTDFQALLTRAPAGVSIVLELFLNTCEVLKVKKATPTQQHNLAG